MTESTTTTVHVTLTETGAPSRSKGRGWLRVPVGTDSVFASTTGRVVELPAGKPVDVVIGVELRRASGRTDKERAAVTVVPTGNPADVVELSLGSPQSYDATITGAVRA